MPRPLRIALARRALRLQSALRRPGRPIPPPAPAQPAAVLSSQQIEERSAKCAKDARERFRNDANQGIADAQGSVAFAQHYNIRLDTCFMVLTAISPENPGVNRPLAGRRRAQADRHRLTTKLYGEYLGWPPDVPPPDMSPRRVPGAESGYCASRGEWEILAAPYMRD